MERKTFLGVAAVAAAAVNACAKSSASELELVEPASQFDYAAFAKLASRPASVRQLWECGHYQPTILTAVKNAYNGYQFGFGIKPQAISMALCVHGNSNAWAYDESMWQKYQIGQTLEFKDPTGAVVASNVFANAHQEPVATADPNDPRGPYQQVTIDALQRRGLDVLVCHTGAAENAREFVRAGVAPNMTEQTVLEDLLHHLIPGAVVVPSQVAAIGLLQTRFHYAYTTA